MMSTFRNFAASGNITLAVASGAKFSLVTINAFFLAVSCKFDAKATNQASAFLSEAKVLNATDNLASVFFVLLLATH